MRTTLSIDKETHDKAVKRAKKDKLSLSVVLRTLLLDYANGNIKITLEYANKGHYELL